MGVAFSGRAWIGEARFPRRKSEPSAKDGKMLRGLSRSQFAHAPSQTKTMSSASLRRGEAELRKDAEDIRRRHRPWVDNRP